MQHFESSLKLPNMYTGIWLITTNIYTFRIFSASKFSHNIFWKINKYRARTSGSGNIERFFDDTTEVFTITDSNAIFSDASSDSNDIYLLEGIVTNKMSCNLSSKAYKWNAVIICSSKSGYKIGSTWTTGNQTDTNFSCCSCIGICFMYQCLFVSGKNNINSTLFI